MARTDEVYDCSGNYFAVGLSALTGITITAGLNSSVLKLISGGSLLVGGVSMVLGTSGLGYLMSVGEALSFNRAGTINIYAVGSTALVTIFNGSNIQAGF